MITLKTLPEATEQQVFDQVVNHLRGQKCKSQSESGHCLYRGPDGTKCAAGCLIADDEYIDEMEAKNWCGLISHGLVTGHHGSLIAKLQEVHDGSPTVSSDWEAELEYVAASFGLKYTPPAA